ncbi:MAG: TonB-dependent receptor [Acidobacteria bacterium]|nr:TonB-dependent receptor [Acidobacteriota bacterium]
MKCFFGTPVRAAFLGIFAAVGACAFAQSAGNSTSVAGTALDPTGAVIPNAAVEIRNQVSGFERTTTTNSSGYFVIPNVPFNLYRLTVSGQGFARYAQDVDVRSLVPLNLSINLKPQTSETVTVEGAADLLENDPTFHTDVDRNLFNKLPLESESSSLSSLVTLSTPGISADSNGLFHGIGDHAENSFSLDGQPITDQQSKVFSNQIPLDAVQSTEVISGAPPAEYGDKTSVVINVTTRSGQGMTSPHGSVTASYGSFGSPNVGFNLGYGGKNWGNFVSANAMNSGRFLDPPEYTVIHDKGNQENLFDRVDYQLSSADSLHLNLGFTRSWFQTPNTFDSELALPWNGGVVNNGGLDTYGNPVGAADQRSEIKTFNVAPSWTRLINNTSAFTLGAYVRRDQFNYYPSSNPFADLGPVNLQRETVSQDRTLTNAGLRSDVSYVKGIHNVKIGATYGQTFLDEGDKLGIVDPTLNPVCLNADGGPNIDPRIIRTSQCGTGPNRGGSLNPGFNPVLLPFDLTRDGGALFGFNGHSDVKELSLYLQDTISKDNWTFNLGVRGDIYNGLAAHREAEPRLGIAYNIKQTNTILRVSYARTLETPFNENLVLSSFGCANPVLSPLLGCFANNPTPLSPGWRNEFHAGLQQAVGRHMVVSGEYIWKYTHNGYDFSVLGNTPITFPIEWQRSKIPGFAGRVSVPNFHGLSVLTVFSSVAARFFTPQIGGAGAVPAAAAGAAGSTPFRIDHDERFNITNHFQYQFRKNGPWFGFNWRYDSGQVAGETPCYGGDCAQTTTTPSGQPAVAVTDSFGMPLSPDQQFESGLFCGSVHATPFRGIPNPCPVPQFGSTLLQVPAPGTQNDDKNPPRIAPRHLFDLAIGHDNLLHGDRYKISAQLTVINLTNKRAIYNFLSTFSGTHYVSPRTVTGQVAFNF